MNIDITAIKTPNKTPKTICLTSKIPNDSIPLFFNNEIPKIVKIYANGSLLPLSISKIGAVEYFKFNLLERRIEKTLAASVEDMTAPIKKLSI